MFTVHLRHNPSGEIRQIVQSNRDWFGEHGFEFFWTEGNFGCDCNRDLEFQRAGGVPEDEISWDQECGEEVFTIVKVTDADGKQIDSELTDTPPPTRSCGPQSPAPSPEPAAR